MAEQMNIVVACDGGLSPYIPTLMVSFFENHRNRDVIFYVMYLKSEAFPKDWPAIQQTADKYQQSVYPIEVPDEALAHVKNTGSVQQGYTASQWLRLLVAEFLPSTVKRAMYVDVDMMVMQDFSAYYDLSFDGKMIIGAPNKPAVVQDVNQRPSRWLTSVSENTEPVPLTGTGMLIFNLELMRQEQVNTQFLNETLDFHYKTDPERPTSDWVHVNTIFRNYLKITDITQPENQGINEPVFIYYKTKTALSDQKLVHFVYNNKPWRYVWDETLLENYSVITKRWQFQPMRVNEDVLPLHQAWWRYAQQAANYDVLYQAAQIRTADLRKLLATTYQPAYEHEQAIKEQFMQESKHTAPFAYSTVDRKWQVLYSDEQRTRFGAYELDNDARDGRLVFPLGIKGTQRVIIHLTLRAHRPKQQVRVFLGADPRVIKELGTLYVNEDTVTHISYEVEIDANEYDYLFFTHWDYGSENAVDDAWIEVSQLRIVPVEPEKSPKSETFIERLLHK